MNNFTHVGGNVGKADGNWLGSCVGAHEGDSVGVPVGYHAGREGSEHRVRKAHVK